MLYDRRGMHRIPAQESHIGRLRTASSVFENAAAGFDVFFGGIVGWRNSLMIARRRWDFGLCSIQ